MKTRTLLTWIVAAGVAGVAAPGWAWGPVTQQAIVTTAVHVLSKEGVAALTKLESEIQEGAAAPVSDLEHMYPGAASDPVHAIETEMNLLDTIRGNVVDPYLGYRLGALGALAARTTAPLANANPLFRDRYYADVDHNIRQTPLKPSSRKVVDAAAYFSRVQQLASTREDMILKEYQDGTGFSAVARAALPEDASRSIDAVADVWYTVLSRKVVHARVSEAQIREYVLDAMRFYVKRGKEAEIDANYARLKKLVPKTPDMAKQLGDTFYDGGLYERAIAEYQVVRAAQPQRRDVVERIADYYVKLGDEAVEKKHLQDALDWYGKAAETDPLHPTAEAKRIQATKLVGERDTRLETARRSIEEAASLQTQSEQLALQRKFSEAMALLEQAQAKYEAVPDEFPTELQAARTGLANVVSRMRELKGELVQNAQTLSGSTFGYDMRQLAASSAHDLDAQALQAIAAHDLRAEMGKLKAQLQEALK